MNFKFYKYLAQYNERNYAPKDRSYLDMLIQKRDNARKAEALCKENVQPVPGTLSKENIVQDYAIISQPEENIIKAMKTSKKRNIKKAKADSYSSQEKLTAKSVKKDL